MHRLIFQVFIMSKSIVVVCGRIRTRIDLRPRLVQRSPSPFDHRYVTDCKPLAFKYTNALASTVCRTALLEILASIAYRKITLSRYDKWEEYTSNEWYQQLVGCKRLGIAWLHFQVTALFWHLGPKCIEKYTDNRRLSAIFSCGEGP